METKEDIRIYEELVSRGEAERWYDRDGNTQYTITNLSWMKDLDELRDTIYKPRRKYLLIKT